MKYAVYETKYDVADIAILMTYLNITPIYKVHKYCSQGNGTMLSSIKVQYISITFNTYLMLMFTRNANFYGYVYDYT